MKHIFLVEDDAKIARNLSRLLSAEEYEVTHVATQTQVAAALTANRFDLALVDISLRWKWFCCLYGD